MFLHLVEETKEEHIEAGKEPTPIPTVIELEPETDTIARTEATPNASVPPNSIASFTYENTPKVDFPPTKRKRGRPAGIRSPTVMRKGGRPVKLLPHIAFTEPGTTASAADSQSLVTPTALPQLMADGDENVLVETDTSGETKVTPTGFLAGGREYVLKTFTIIGHGKKLFMLATDIARLTGYRDSYLFFLRNRRLRKVVTTHTEKGDLISQGVIPFSYRSRKISVVTARSIFIQFGHRVIINGQRIRDDYYEERARKDNHVETRANEGQELQHQAAVATATEAMSTSNTLNAHLPPLAPLAITSTIPHSDVLPRKYPLLQVKPPIFGPP
jgi:Chromatin remodelling complex Rsc7/Swp82 subunit